MQENQKKKPDLRSLVLPRNKPKNSKTYAAVDLGSNSFHMIVAETEDGQLKMVDRLRAMVRLASALTADKRLEGKVVDVALETLANFGQRLYNIPAGNIRIVGTNTLRQAVNSQEFLDAAEKILGHPIEVISGREEARLVFLGAAHSLAEPRDRRLVVDIGGGSTELVVGEKFDARNLESISAGCVSISQHYFADGTLSKKRFRKAILAAQILVQPYSRVFRNNWDHVVGTSGTIRSIERVAKENGWSDSGITPAALDKIEQAMISAGTIENLSLSGLSKNRSPVFPGGYAVLSAIFTELNINHMHVTDGALREGLLFDMIGRRKKNDIRDNTINHLKRRCGVDELQADSVKKTAQQFLLLADIGEEDSMEDWSEVLGWVADVHEIGLDISHHAYQKHGGYILRNADMMGFSQQEQKLLANIVESQRGRLDRNRFSDLPEEWRQIAYRLTIFLRLSLALHRSRLHEDTKHIGLVTKENMIELTFPEHWLEVRPLTGTDLAKEKKYLSEVGFSLNFPE